MRQDSETNIIVLNTALEYKIDTLGVYLQFVVVVKVGGFQVFLADDFHDGVFELFLERDVLAAGVQLIQQLLASTSLYWFTSQHRSKAK